jgi:hypothetical protein
MARRKIIPNGTVMRWKFNRNRDIYLTVRVLDKVKREKGQWQKYRIEVLLQPDGRYAKYVGKEFLAQGNRLFAPIPKFDTIEEVEAWLESQ